MSTVITAYYDSRAKAEQVQQQLTGLGILDQDHGANRHQVHHQESANYRAGHYSNDTDRGLWDKVRDSDNDGDTDFGLLPDRDRHNYEEGVHRGGAVLTVTVDDSTCERACAIIRNSGAEDIDTHAAKWEASGWSRPSTGSESSSRWSRDSATEDDNGSYRTYRYEG